jgi:hypothetical protein
MDRIFFLLVGILAACKGNESNVKYRRKKYEMDPFSEFFFFQQTFGHDAY